jgi:arylsulfatase A-like enzyme
VGSDLTYQELDDHSRPNLPDELRANNVAIQALTPGDDNFIFDAISRVYTQSEVTAAQDDLKNPIDFAPEHLTELTNSGKPFFLLVHTFEAHEPYKPPSPYNTYFDTLEGYPDVTALDLANINTHAEPATPDVINAYRLRYDQQLRQSDDHIARFLNNIATSTLEHTVIILAADHGEAFYEHGSVRHGNSGLYQEELHIPLMMRIPGVSPRRIMETVSLMDMAPTILSFFDIPAPQTFNGKSLLPLIQGHPLGERIIPLVTGIPPYLDLHAPVPKTLDAAGARPNEAVIPASVVGARQGTQKVMYFTAGPKKGTWEWYDLAHDPKEENNLATGTATLPPDLVAATEALRAKADALSATAK